MSAKPAAAKPSSPDPARALLREARRALDAGNPHQAVALARRIAKSSPRDPGALNACAWVAHQARDGRAAARFLEQSLAADPHQVETLSNLATLYHADGRHDQAVALLDRALVGIAVDDAAAASLHYNRGNALKALGRLDEAEAAFRAALARQSDAPAFHGNLANTLVALGRPDEAVASYRQSLALRPDHAETLRHLAATLRRLRRLDEAATVVHSLLALEPDQGESQAALGSLLRDRGDSAGATEAFHRAVALSPQMAEAHLDLGALLLRESALSAALGCFETALTLKPDFAEAQLNVGNILTQQGQLDVAMIALERARALAPDDPAMGSGLLFAAQYLPDLAPAELARRHAAWAARHMDGLVAAAPKPAAEPGRRLRVGYVSGDFRRHAVGDFLLPLLQHHDHTQIEIACYAEVAHPDQRTAAFETLATLWRSTVGMTDAQVAALVRADAIDLLVDLSGHTANHRLGVFARKPAPLQVSWLGYPSTTGLAAIDYRLTDAIADPAPDADALHRERLIRLPHGFHVYVPPRATPAVAPPPSSASAAPTFGSFNNLAKVNARVVAAWTRILAAVPNSRLMLKSHQLADAPTRALVRARFTAGGIAPERILVEPGIGNWHDHMAAYGALDIALDPFPYNGTTTTCEASWMGVPVIALRGDRHAGRVGASLLTRLGLDALIADDIDDYVAKAVALAGDRERLTALRSAQRGRFAASPLGDPVGFARDVEAAYREIWRAWCTGATT